MQKGAFSKIELMDFVKPLVILPYCFWFIRLIETGFNFLQGVLGAILFLLFLPALVIYWVNK